MGEIFGTRWYETNGPEATNLWQQSLTEWSLHRGAAVIEYYRTSGHAHPPTLSEIVHVARTLKIAADKPPTEAPKRITGPVIKSERTAAEFARLRNMKRSGSENAFYPGEGLGEYLAALNKSGMKEQEFAKYRVRSKKEKADPEAHAERLAIQTESDYRG